MKKTLIALMALAGLAYAEDVVWTMSNGDILGGSNLYSRTAIQFTLTNDGDSYTAVPSVTGADFTKSQILQSITFWTPSKLENGVKGILIDSTGTILATTISSAANGQANQPLTFDFSASNVALSSNSTYTLAFTTYNNSKAFVVGTKASTNAGDYSKPGVYVAKNANSVYDISDLHYYNMGQGTNDVTDLPAIKIITKAVPEPTTATLSLLALAGLAARRRRASR